MSTRRLRSKRKLILAAVAGATIFGGAYGLADSLGLTTDTLGAGNTVVAACQATAMHVTWAPSFSSSLPGYNVTSVTVTGLTSTCNGLSYKVTVYGAGGTSIGEATGIAPAAPATTMGPFSIPGAASAVTGVAVVFAG